MLSGITVFPINDNQGINSTIFSHFGSAPFFLLFNTDTNTVKIIENKNLNHEHGKCNPLKTFSSLKIDNVITGGIGANAIEKLEKAKISIYQTKDKNLTVKDIIDNQELIKIIHRSDACSGHDHHKH